MLQERGLATYNTHTKAEEHSKTVQKTAKLRLTRAHFEHQFILLLEERGPATYLVVEGRPILS